MGGWRWEAVRDALESTERTGGAAPERRTTHSTRLPVIHVLGRMRGGQVHWYQDTACADAKGGCPRVRGLPVCCVGYAACRNRSAACGCTSPPLRTLARPVSARSYTALYVRSPPLADLLLLLPTPSPRQVRPVHPQGGRPPGGRRQRLPGRGPAHRGHLQVGAGRGGVGNREENR